MKKGIAFTALLLMASPASAQTPSPEAVPRIDLIQFDGVVDSAEWDHIPLLPTVTYDPVYGAEPTVETELRLAYDDEYIYLAVRAFDFEPLTMTTYKRDSWSGRDDQIALALDSYNDYETASVFVTYASGARVDAQLSNDGRAISDMNTDWNTFWDAEVTHHPDGWQAEVRIPLSTLRFETPPEGQEVVMGIAAYRYKARGSEQHNYPGIRPDWGFWSFLKPSRMARRSFRGIRSKLPAYVSPYTTGGLSQVNGLENGVWQLDNSPTVDFGLDAKYSVTSNLTADGTINTDFAQVEADDQQVNLTRFSLFFPEKRQFFLERISNFDFSFGGFDRVFYSRRIGLSGGEEVPILGGGRLVGRTGDWDIGLLTLQTGTAGEVDAENFGVARLKRRVLNPNSYLGGIATSRTNFDGRHNAVYGLDTRLNLSADDYLLVNWAQSFDSSDPEDTTFLERARMRLELIRQRSTGLGFGLGYQRAGAQYSPRAGFQRRTDYSSLTGSLGSGVRPEDSPLAEYALRSRVELFFRNEDGSLETGTASVTLNAMWASQYGGAIGVTFNRENLLDGFSLGDGAGVWAGTYDFLTLQTRFETPGGNRLRLEGDVELGGFFDGKQVVVSVSPELSISPRLLLGGSYSYNGIRFDDRGEEFTAHVVRSRIDASLNTAVTFSAFIQYVSSAQAVIANARVRWNPRDGNDLYLVWNEVTDTERAGFPVPPRLIGRTLVAKYTHTFAL